MLRWVFAHSVQFYVCFSKELVHMLLEKYHELSKDHNLFYIAVEIEIQKKGIFIDWLDWLTG